MMVLCSGLRIPGLFSIATTVPVCVWMYTCEFPSQWYNHVLCVWVRAQT